MKTTQKQLIAIFKETRVNVLSFDPETGTRASSYGLVDILTALREVTRRTAEGKRVLILDPDLDESIKWEIRNRGRVPFEVCLPWTITGFNHPLFKTRK